MYNKLKVTYPNNFARFKCIGGECEDTCCAGWEIDIDDESSVQEIIEMIKEVGYQPILKDWERI